MPADLMNFHLKEQGERDLSNQKNRENPSSVLILWKRGQLMELIVNLAGWLRIQSDK